MKTISSALLCLLAAFAVSACAKSSASLEAARAASAPGALLGNERNLADIMRNYPRAVPSPQPWAGYWWPYVGTGIAAVYRDDAGMSPADKYDAAYLDYLRSRGSDTSQYQSMAAWERTKHGPGAARVESWWGHCNGWAASSVMVPEPRAPKTIAGLNFGVRDLKALLAESWMEFSGDFVGTRVDTPGDFSSAAFWDVVPAQFHLMLANIAGRQNRSLILDRHTGHEIWNQPLVAYEFDQPKASDYLGAHPSFPDVYRINMTARIWWANDNVDPDDVTPPFDIVKLHDEFYDYYFPGRLLKYELWLDGPVEFDSNGNIARSGDILVTREDGRYVGGVWKNGTSPAALIHTHPDYMWVPYGVQHSSGYKNARIDDTWVRENIGAARER
jgi:hypothetical protein